MDETKKGISLGCGIGIGLAIASIVIPILIFVVILVVGAIGTAGVVAVAKDQVSHAKAQIAQELQNDLDRELVERKARMKAMMMEHSIPMKVTDKRHVSTIDDVIVFDVEIDVSTYTERSKPLKGWFYIMNASDELLADVAVAVGVTEMEGMDLVLTHFVLTDGMEIEKYLIIKDAALGDLRFYFVPDVVVLP